MSFYFVFFYKKKFFFCFNHLKDDSLNPNQSDTMCMLSCLFLFKLLHIFYALLLNQFKNAFYWALKNMKIQRRFRALIFWLLLLFYSKYFLWYLKEKEIDAIRQFHFKGSLIIFNFNQFCVCVWYNLKNRWMLIKIFRDASHTIGLFFYLKMEVKLF